MNTIDFVNLGIGLAALVGGLAMLGFTLRRHRRDHPKGVAMLIAAMMVTAFGLFITAFAIAFAFGPANLEGAR
jgi:hypothetical protein